MSEIVLMEADQLYRWEGPKRKQTLLSATLGRVVLTDQRLLFLSSGKHDVTIGKALAGASGNALRATRTDSTAHLDLGALANKGSLDLPLASVAECNLQGMFKCLAIHYVDASGQRQATTFAPKTGGMPGGQTWIDAITQARAAQAGQVPRGAPTPASFPPQPPASPAQQPAPSHQAAPLAPFAPPPPPPPAVLPREAAGWYPDPSGRHELRFWDGSAWSAHVSDHGTVGNDPSV